MGSHPLNLALRFVLELSALTSFGFWGWHQRHDGWQIVFAVAAPLFAACLWGVFAVPNDPSRSGSAPVPVAGWIRLALELGFFGAAVYACYDLGRVNLAAIFTVVVATHYALSSDRILWLVKR